MKIPPLRVFTHAELEAVYAATLQVLETVGMVLDHPAALERLAGVGARVDRATSRVYFPPELVEQTVARIPRRYTYHGRTPEFDFTAALDGDIGARTGFGMTGYIDPRTDQYRRAGIADWREFCTLVDALPNIRALATINPGDAPPRVSDLHSLRAALEVQRKCSLHTAITIEHLRYQIEMMVAVRGSREALAERPLVHVLTCPISPLYLAADDAAQILVACEYELPIDVAVLPIVGMTAPITVAGTLVQALAEVLGTATLIQTARPGHPMTFLLGPVVGNLRTGNALTGAPEKPLLLAAICQLGTELFGLPTPSMGLYADGFSGAQAMFQKAQNLMAAVLAGGKLVVAAGSIESIMTNSPVQLVIDNELMAIARRWVRGSGADDDALALDAIARVGPRGDYLSDEHTLLGLRAGELLDPPLSERQGSRPMWEATGRPTLESKAHAEVLSLLASHEVPPLPEEVLRELATITAHADKDLSGE